MKKITTLFLIVLLFSYMAVPVLAQSDKSQGASKKPSVTQDKAKKDSEEKISPSELLQSKNAVKKLNKISEETNDPEVAEEVDKLVEEQEVIEVESDKAIEEIDGRPSLVRFLIGPDYKNLGQLRKDVVQLRNNIRQLENLQERVGADEHEVIEVAILELEETAAMLQSKMYEKLSGFSLFGWLFRWMNGFTPMEEVNPTPSPVVSPTPSASPDPTVTPSPTPTPEPSPTSL